VTAPNFLHEPNWNPSDITHLLSTLGCPYQIRSDAITAVGAPSSIGYLVRALYWLYQVAKNFYVTIENVPSVIQEDSEENKESMYDNS